MRYNTSVRIEATDDIFLCCLVSHGALGKIYVVDGVTLDVSQIAQCFELSVAERETEDIPHSGEHAYRHRENGSPHGDGGCVRSSG